MSWFKPKASQEDFDQFEAQVIRVTDNQRREISKLEGKIQALETSLSLLRVRVTELETSNKPLADSNVKRQAEGFNRLGETFQGRSNVTHTYTDSSPDLSTVMLVSALVSDSGPSSSCSCDSYSSSSYDSSSSSSSDSSSSCGGE